ncbi:uncharacterized protein LOC118443644 isoform X4 [Vespa mandarinia]|uniref:uncharacterized protein LOC118443644 isoform X4 n=1 Tax=Vespa mandarinia TaxID=7446 RepID=UPI00161D75DA|nr:uncharacterized protein LOC118443644 isoform X4 [Vespa mandarinia]
MRKFILIRTYREEDKPVCKELLKSSVMYPLNHTFIGFLLGTNVMRIINVLSIVLMVVLLQTGFYVVYCIMVIFIPGIILYISLLSKFLYEARIVGNEVSEISRICTPSNSSRFWIAEAYEDLSVNNQEQDQPYIFMTQEKLNECNIDISQYNKKIVGIMSVCKSNWEPTVAWIKRLYVQKKYRRKGIGRQFINRAIHFAEEYRFECVKAIINEFQKVVIHFFNAKNFTLKIIRDQSYLMTIMMYEYTYLTRHSNQIS